MSEGLVKVDGSNVKENDGFEYARERLEREDRERMEWLNSRIHHPDADEEDFFPPPKPVRTKPRRVRIPLEPLDMKAILADRQRIIDQARKRVK